MKASELTANPDFAGRADTRLHGHWLTLAWVGWSILTLLSLIDFETRLPSAVERAIERG